MGAQGFQFEHPECVEEQHLPEMICCCTPSVQPSSLIDIECERSHILEWAKLSEKDHVSEAEFDVNEKNWRAAKIVVIIDKYIYNFGNLGIKYDLTDEKVVTVMSVELGAVHAYNRTTSRCLQIQPWDQIIEVNGSSGDGAELLQHAHCDNPLRMVLHRPSKKAIRLSKSEGTLGIDVMVRTASSFLLVTKVGHGAVENWNRNNPETALKEGCRIVEMNGLSGTGEELLGALTNNDSVNIVFFSYNN